MATTFDFSGQLWVVIKIKDRTYTLISETLHTEGGATKTKFRYLAATLEEAIPLGTMNEIVEGTSTLVDVIGDALKVKTKLNAAEWTSNIADKATKLPIIGTVFSSIINTEARITELVIELDAEDTKAAATVGIAFICPANTTMLGIGLQSAGMRLTFDCDPA